MRINSMGRQIHFYMLEKDQNEFFDIVQNGGETSVTVRDSNSSTILPLKDIAPDSGATLCLWNKKLLPNLTRKWISDADYYRIDTLTEPILEFMPSFRATWEGKPALGQGRLLGNFETYLGKPKSFEEWYQKLVNWIHKHYRKSSASLGGYVGPEALEFFKQGGYLLPNFLPPESAEWIAEIDKQHI